MWDEAHHLTGRADLATHRIVEPGWLPAALRLYATATPRVELRGNATGMVPVYAMDDEAVFGPVLSTYPFATAIAEGYLADYRLAVIGVTVACLPHFG